MWQPGGEVNTVTLAEVLALISLLNYIAFWSRGISKVWMASRDDWGHENHGFDKMPEVIRFALRYCLHQGSIDISDRNSEHFVQFQKYILLNGKYGLEFCLPKTGWSKPYFSKLRDTLTADGVLFQESRESDEDVTALIRVDCGQDIDKATDLARRCFFEIFDLAQDTRFKLEASNFSTSHDDIDGPVSSDPRVSEFWNGFRDARRWDGMEDPSPFSIIIKSIVFGGFVFFVYPALWWSWLVANGSPPDWNLSVGSIQLTGSNATWVLMLTYFVLLVGARSISQENADISRREPMSRTDRIVKVTFLWALPLAVISSWIGI